MKKQAATGHGAPVRKSATASASAAWPLGNVFTWMLPDSTMRRLMRRQLERHGASGPIARGGLVWIQGSIPKQRKSTTSTTVQKRSAGTPASIASHNARSTHG